jgi:hypothetical protein
MYASPESGLALKFTGRRRMSHEQLATSACRLFMYSSAIGHSVARVKAGEERTSKTDARLLCPPRRPPRFLALRWSICRHSPH